MNRSAPPDRPPQHELHPSPPAAPTALPLPLAADREVAELHAPEAAPADPAPAAAGPRLDAVAVDPHHGTRPEGGQHAEHPEQHHAGREHHTKPTCDRKHRQGKTGERETRGRPQPVRQEARERIAVGGAHWFTGRSRPRPAVGAAADALGVTDRRRVNAPRCGPAPPEPLGRRRRPGRAGRAAPFMPKLPHFRTTEGCDPLVPWPGAPRRGSP